jgi:glycosyltransferase involved in cell wall biosynthesis
VKPLAIQWILNGCGLEAGSITGGPVRFHEVARRWRRQAEATQRLMTTSGGEGMLRAMGCDLPVTTVRAALLLRREPWRGLRLWSYLLSAAAGRRAAAALPPCDAAVTVSDYFCDIVPALALKRRRPTVRWIAWIHHRELPPGSRPGSRLVNSVTWRLQEWSFRRIAAHADQAWFYDTEAGDHVRERLLALGMPPRRLRAMRCGIDLDAIRRAPRRTATTDAVMVGVRPNKGLHDILPVWERLQQLRPGTTLRLLGGMSGAQSLLEEIRRRGMSSLIRTPPATEGFLPPAEYHAALKEARVLFAPSHEEGWGIAVGEAMAAGLPVVAYDLPVYRRIYGTAFEAVPCFDHDAFAAALARTLDDPARRDALRQAGLRQAAAHDWESVAADDLRALRELLRERDAATPAAKTTSAG